MPGQGNYSKTNWFARGRPLAEIVKAVFVRTWRRVMRDDCADLAAQVSFYFVLSLFPFFLVIAAIIGWLPYTSIWGSFVEWSFTYLPRLSRSGLFETILGLGKWHRGLLSFGLVGTIWSASSGFVSLMEAMSVAYGAQDKRSFWKKRAIGVAATIGAALFFVLTFGLWSVGRWAEGTVTSRLAIGGLFKSGWSFAWWVMTLALLCLLIDLLNYFLPNCPRPWKWMTPGTFLVAGAFVLASIAVNLYARYNAMLPQVYGALAGFIVLLLWIYVATLILLIGAETDTAMAEIEKHGVSAPEAV